MDTQMTGRDGQAGDPLADVLPPGRIVTLPPNSETFGAVLDFLARVPPFDRHALGPISRAVRRQVVRAEHVATLDGLRLVGYLGWLPCTQAVAEAWRSGAGKLVTAEGDAADAVVLTLLGVVRGGLLLPLIRAARERNPSRRVYFKRSYANTARAERKSVVYNVSFTGPDAATPPVLLR